MLSAAAGGAVTAGGNAVCKRRPDNLIMIFGSGSAVCESQYL